MTVTVKMSKDITPQSLKNAERNMGPRLKWNVLFKWYWSEWYRIKEKEVLNNVHQLFFFLKAYPSRTYPPLKIPRNKFDKWATGTWIYVPKKNWGKLRISNLKKKTWTAVCFHFPSRNSTLRISSYPPVTIPRLQTNHNYCADHVLSVSTAAYALIHRLRVWSAGRWIVV